MEQKQLIHLLQFIVIGVLIGVFVIFVMEESFVDFILKYWLYFLIVSISYFYYYNLEYNLDKKSKLIKNVIIYGNLYLFFHIFFRPLLNISHELFILLGLIVLGVWWTTKLNTRWRYPMQIIGFIFSFFILISGVFYLYPEKPDIEGFIDNRMYEISVSELYENVSKNDAYIQITDSKKNNDYELVPYFNKQLVESCKISYPSKKRQRDEKVYIITPYGDIFWLFPQSELQINFDNINNIDISRLNGEIGYLTGIFDSSINISGDLKELTTQQQKWLEGIQYLYRYDLVSYLKAQISDSSTNLTNSTIMYNIDGKILKILAGMFPASFSKNLQNYEKFQEYFNRTSSEDIDSLVRYSTKQSSEGFFSSFWDNLIKNMKIGTKNTYDIFKEH